VITKGNAGNAFTVDGSVTAVTAGVTYRGNITQSNAGAMVSVTSHTTGTITFQTGTLSAGAGTGLQFTNADGTYNFAGTTTLNGGDAGIDILNGSAGTFAFGGTTITNPTGVALNVDGSAAAVTGGIAISGAISKTSGGRLIDFNNYDSGTATISGTLTCNTSCQGIEVTNDGTTSGTVNFTGATKTLNTGTTTAVNLDNNDGGTINFTGGGLDIDTTSGIGFNVTNGGTVTVQGSTNTINSSGGKALNIADTTIGAGALTFQSLSANGGANGMVLNNTGSTAGLIVTGSGSTDGSGGTIQNTTTRGAEIQNVRSVSLSNMNFTNANATVDGGAAGSCDDLTITGCNAAIYLSNVTTGATLDNLNLTGTMVENGITAINVANFKFDNGLIDGAGDEPHESGIEAQNLSGTATVNNSEIRFSETDSFAVTNTDVSVSLTISGSTFRDTQTVSSGGAVNINGEGGFQFRSGSVAAGAPVATINILNSSFLRLRTQGVQVFAGDDTTINLDITGSTIDAQTDIGTGIDINADDTAILNFNITNNPTIQSRGGAAVNITSFLNGHIEGRVNNNPDIEVLGGPGIPVRVVPQETSTAIVEISGNTVSNVNGTEDTVIDVQSRFQTAQAQVTITNNTVTGEPTGIAGIDLISGSSTAGESNVTCANVFGNNVTNAAGNTIRAFRIRVSDLSNANRLYLQGFVEAGTSLQDVEATWNGRSNLPTSSGGSEVAASLTGTAVGPSAPPGGACATVDTPTDFLASVSGGRGYWTAPAAVGDTVTGASGVRLTRTAQPRVGGAAGTEFSGAVSRAIARSFGMIARAVRGRTNDASRERVELGTRESSPVPESGSVPNTLAGETVTVNVGTLPAGKSVTITYRATIATAPITGPGFALSTQGTVTGTNFAAIVTDDPDTADVEDATRTAMACPTITIAPADVAPGVLGTAMTPVTFTATGGIGTTTLALSGTLPSGVSFDAPSATLSGTPTQTGSFPFSITATDQNGCEGTQSYTLLVRGGRTVLTGADAGGGPHVRRFSAIDGTTPTSGALDSFFAFDASFAGGVRVAEGDVNGDGEPDYIAAAGPGADPRINVFDGATGGLMYSILAFEPGFPGGVFVAAGDVDGDGYADVIAGSGAGRSGQVKVFSGYDGRVLRDTFVFERAFTGGVSVAAGDVNGDGRADLVVGSGAGRPSEVRVLNAEDGSILRAFTPYGAFAGGVFVAAADVTGDGFADIVTGAGAGGGPHVLVVDGVTGAATLSFFAFEPGFAGGVRVAAGDVTGDGRADVIAGAGPGRTAAVRVFDGATAASVSETEPYGPYPSGVFVATDGPLNRMAVNPPAPGAVIHGPFTAAGWAFVNHPANAGIAAIHVWAVPMAGGAPTFLGLATLGDTRPDVAALYGAQYGQAGFHLEAAALPPGVYYVAVYAQSSVTGTFQIVRVVPITVTP
jgi:hypothetical protein